VWVLVMWLVVALAIVGVARSVGQETNENRRSGNRSKEPRNR
jgi:Tfp pilus assembly protein PilX